MNGEKVREFWEKWNNDKKILICAKKKDRIDKDGSGKPDWRRLYEAY